MIYETYIAKSRYARYIDDVYREQYAGILQEEEIPKENRREHWEETVTRYCRYMERHVGKNFPYKRVYNAIVNKDVMPSMRALMTAGPALTRDNTAGFNCCALPVDDPKSFDEAMHILLNGTGVGFSVEWQYVKQLPEIPDRLFESDTIVVVKDSKEGWAKALRQVIALLYSGEIPKWDMSLVRPAGERLKTFGGRASGPEPLHDLFVFVCDIFRKAAGRRLSTLECHDIMCKIAEVVVVGGVRRSALISLSDLHDTKMRDAKSGRWWETAPHRALANNSAVYTNDVTLPEFMEEWVALYKSQSGERGIFNRDAAKKIAAATGRRDPDYNFLTNPLISSGCAA